MEVLKEKLKFRIKNCWFLFTSFLLKYKKAYLAIGFFGRGLLRF